MTRAYWFPLLIALMCSVIAQHVIAQPTSPCQRDEYHQFDFWLGTWEVKTPDGKLAGVNRITRQLNACVIREHYKTPNGFEGYSFNTFNVQTNQWHQTWVDNGGMLLILNGQFDGTSMVLSGDGKTPDGTEIKHRITWTPSEAGSVRQHWQMSKDAGASWVTLFDGTYYKTQSQSQDSSHDL